jgi:hypothetical protein
MNTTIDINILPKDAQNELRDFYEFLVKKYVRKAARQKDEDKNSDSFIHQLIQNPLDAKKFKPFERDELYEDTTLQNKQIEDIILPVIKKRVAKMPVIRAKGIDLEDMVIDDRR